MRLSNQVFTDEDGQPLGDDFLTEEEYLDILETLPKENQYLDDSDPE
jgi:DNA-directed RNA polymerase subunit beta'